jgi:hypothetical protein
MSAAATVALEPPERPVRRCVRARAFEVVRIGLGVVLLIVAGLKLRAQNTGSMPPLAGIPFSQLVVIAAEWEIILGLWLVSGWHRRLARFAALCTFFGFAIVSAYLARLGMASCGCFGASAVSPWITLALDVGIVIILIVMRPEAPSSGAVPRAVPGFWDSSAFALPIGATLFLLMVTCLGTWRYGSPAGALAHLRGEWVFVQPDLIDFGNIPEGQIAEADITITNVADLPVCVLGANTTCDFSLAPTLPLCLDPRKSQTLRLRFFPRSAQSLRDELRLVLNGREKPTRIPVRATATSIPGSEAHGN